MKPIARWFVAFAFCLCSSVFAAPSDSLEVRLVGWPQPGKTAGFFAAKQGRLYDIAGVRFELVSSFQASLATLSVGQAELAIVTVSEAANAIRSGAPFQIIAILDGRTPIATMSLKSRAVREPRDLVGKTVAIVPGNAPEVDALRELARLHKFDFDEVKIVPVAWESQLPLLLSGKVDVIPAWIGSGLPIKSLAAKQAGAEVEIMQWADHGLDVYGECIVARKDWATSNRAALKEFLRQSALGFGEVFANEAGAVDQMIKADARLTPRREELRLSLEQLRSSLNVPNPFIIDIVKMRRSLRTFVGPSAGDAYFDSDIARF